MNSRQRRRWRRMYPHDVEVVADGNPDGLMDMWVWCKDQFGADSFVVRPLRPSAKALFRFRTSDDATLFLLRWS